MEFINKLGKHLNAIHTLQKSLRNFHTHILDLHNQRQTLYDQINVAHKNKNSKQIHILQINIANINTQLQILDKNIHIIANNIQELNQKVQVLKARIRRKKSKLID